MRRIVFYVDPQADPPVEQAALVLHDDSALIDTGRGLKRVDALVVGDTYRWDHVLRRIDRVEVLQ